MNETIGRENRALVLANGTPPPREVLAAAREHAGLFVCADGGANAAMDLGARPEAIVGDLDSATPQVLAHFSGVPVIEDRDTSRTDLEKAVEYVLERGAFREVVVLGASRGRLDHVIGHLSLMLRFLPRARVVLEDEQVRAFVAHGDVRLDLPAGAIVSFFAVGEPVHGVTTENLLYPLSGATLRMGSQDSVSNVVKKSPAWIRHSGGLLLVFEVRMV